MLRKTDSEVEQWVLRELGLREKICSREICVLARDGMVSLRGSAQSYQDKLALEEATRRAPGVVGVLNELTVKPNATLLEKASVKLPVPEPLSPNVLVHPIAPQRTPVNTTR
jgi:hypothetical protein